MPRLLLILAVIALAVYALADLARTPQEEIGDLPKWIWVVIIIVAPVIGSLAWIVMRNVMAKRTRGQAQGGRTYGGSGYGGGYGGGRSARGSSAGGPVAPDDDPEFLWLLDQARRKREAEAEESAKRGHFPGRGQGSGKPGTTPAGSGPGTTASAEPGDDTGPKERPTEGPADDPQ
jgi:hypothetical protein